MNETFARFDSADYLNSFDDVTAYLETVLDDADDDPTVIASALGAIARSRNFSQIAREGGMSREGLYKARRRQSLSGHSPELAHALGLRLHVEATA